MYCSSDKDSLPCRGELISVRYFIVSSPYSQTTFVTVLRYFAVFLKELMTSKTFHAEHRINTAQNSLLFQGSINLLHNS